jgi:hypothetical protein
MALAVISSLMAFVVSPANAQTATAPEGVGNLNPSSGFDDKDQLSDFFDGVDSTAHLTAIASPRADRVQWFVCAGTATTPAVGGGSCTAIGEDTTGVQAVASSGSGQDFNAGSLEAYEFNWDIPSAFDDDATTYNIVTRACNGAASANTQGAGAGSQSGVPENCRDTVDSGIDLDDGSTPNLAGQDIQTGEIVSFCTGTLNECNPTTVTNGTGTGAFTPLTHGSSIPSANFTVKFRTSADVTAAGACTADLTSAPAEQPTGDLNPVACDVHANSVTNVTPSGTTTFREYHARFTSTTSAADRQPMDLAIYGRSATGNDECPTSGSGNFTGSGVTYDTAGSGDVCVLDEHLVVGRTTTATTRSIVATFDNTTVSPGTTANCQPADTAETNRLGTTDVVTACSLDAFGRGESGQTITFESTGVGTLTCTATSASATTTTPAGTTNAATQRCTAVTDANGRATATLSNTNTAPATTGNTNANGTPGTQNVIACFDVTPATTTNPVGCSSETAGRQSAVTKTWVTVPAHVHLVYSGTGDAADPCHTGDQFKTNEIGDTDTLLACVFDARTVERPSSTAGTDSDSATNTFSLNWTTSNSNSVAFASNPPTETGADGRATMQIRAVAAGSSTITVQLRCAGSTFPSGTTCPSDGILASAQVTKTVEPGGQPECNDSVDNDGDGTIDFPQDPGCASIDDDTEINTPPGTIPAACRNRGSGENVIVGTDGADVLTGTSGRDVICGAGGDDVISARGGNDLAQGNGGGDTVGGGGGKDNLSGNGGNDNVSGNKGNDAVKGQGGQDTLKGNAGIDSITGGAGNDSAQGGDGNDIVKGNDGDDTLRGGAGADLLDGGSGNDGCFGNAGADKVKNCE